MHRARRKKKKKAHDRPLTRVWLSLRARTVTAIRMHNSPRALYAYRQPPGNQWMHSFCKGHACLRLVGILLSTLRALRARQQCCSGIDTSLQSLFCHLDLIVGFFFISTINRYLTHFYFSDLVLDSEDLLFINIDVVSKISFAKYVLNNYVQTELFCWENLIESDTWIFQKNIWLNKPWLDETFWKIRLEHVIDNLVLWLSYHKAYSHNFVYHYCMIPLESFETEYIHAFFSFPSHILEIRTCFSSSIYTKIPISILKIYELYGFLVNILYEKNTKNNTKRILW